MNNDAGYLVPAELVQHVKKMITDGMAARQAVQVWRTYGSVEYEHEGLKIFSTTTRDLNINCYRCCPEADFEGASRLCASQTIAFHAWVCSPCLDALSIMPDIEFYDKIVKAVNKCRSK